MDVEFLEAALAQEHYRTQTQAIHRAIAMLDDETPDEPLISAGTASLRKNRFRIVWKVIATQADAEMFGYFCHEFKNTFEAAPIYLDLMIDGLAELLANNAEQKGQTSETILAAQIFFGVYDSTWLLTVR